MNQSCNEMPRKTQRRLGLAIGLFLSASFVLLVVAMGSDQVGLTASESTPLFLAGVLMIGYLVVKTSTGRVTPQAAVRHRRFAAILFFWGLFVGVGLFVLAFETGSPFQAHQFYYSPQGQPTGHFYTTWKYGVAWPSALFTLGTIFATGYVLSRRSRESVVPVKR